MDRQETKSRRKRADVSTEEHHCILCEVIIEVSEHDVFFATGRYRFCHETLENND